MSFLDVRHSLTAPTEEFAAEVLYRTLASKCPETWHVQILGLPTHRVTGSPKRIETFVPIIFLLFPGDLFFTPAGLRTVLLTEVMVASATQNSLQDSQLGSCLTCLDDKSTIPGPTFGMALTTSRPSGLRVRHVAHCSRAFAPCDPQCGAVPDADRVKNAETPVAKRKT